MVSSQLTEDAGIRTVRLGHAPNCSSAGSIVGAALLSAIGAAVVINVLAARFFRWRSEPPGPGREHLTWRPEVQGGTAHFPRDGARLVLDPTGAELAVSGHPNRSLPVVGTGVPTGPGEVHLAVSSACSLPCEGCYLDTRPGPRPDEAALEEGKAALRELVELGVFEVALGGGEAGLGSEVAELAEAARGLGLVPNVTTSGIGLRPDLAKRLAAAVGQVNVSVDGLTTYSAVRGWGSATAPLKAIDELRAAGARVGVNTVITRQNIGELDDLAEELSHRGVAEWQWLRWKPAGRGALRYPELALREEEFLQLWPKTLELEARFGLTIRWDCAMVPFLAAHGLDPEPARLLGLRGCTGGEDLLARTADGRYVPCSFAKGGAAGPAAEAWKLDSQLLAWRDRAASPPEPCRSCDWQPLCRGGCRIVAEHLTGDALAPDPECPKVAAHLRFAACTPP